jgi:hypothetical protein
VKRANTSRRAAVASTVPSPSNGGRFVSIMDARPANDVAEPSPHPSPTEPGRRNMGAAGRQAAATERFLRLIARCIARELLARQTPADNVRARPVRAKK